MRPMNRREALKAAGLIAGGAFLASGGILTACRGEPRARPTDRLLDADQQSLAEEIADTLLPTTASSPGAKAAGVGPAMNLIVSDCYKAADRAQVLSGLETFRTTCRSKRGKDFVELTRTDREAFVRNVANEKWFGPVRDLALGAYFSSEMGMTKALRYVLVPGKYVGCMPLEPGQPAWG
jgi:glucoside 3-dehydrogenase (cytochrome c) hitch-hiker subunit